MARIMDFSSLNQTLEPRPYSARYSALKPFRSSRHPAISSFEELGNWVSSRPLRAAVGPLDKHHLDLLPYSTASSVVRPSDANARIEAAWAPAKWSMPQSLHYVPYLCADI